MSVLNPAQQVQKHPVYVVALPFTPASPATDMVIIEGSASKIVRVISFRLVTPNNVPAGRLFRLNKRSSVDTGGTFVSAGTPVPIDSDSPPSTVNRVGHFTANPVLGTLVGIIDLINLIQNISSEFASQYSINSDARLTALHGINECLAIGLGNVALPGAPTYLYRIVWTESDL